MLLDSCRRVRLAALFIAAADDGFPLRIQDRLFSWPKQTQASREGLVTL
jgi:hypothetical protein